MSELDAHDSTKAAMAGALRERFAGDAQAEALDHLDYLWSGGETGRYSDAMHGGVWNELAVLCGKLQLAPSSVPRMMRAIAVEAQRYTPLPV